jgi:streptogrisin C
MRCSAPHLLTKARSIWTCLLLAPLLALCSLAGAAGAAEPPPGSSGDDPAPSSREAAVDPEAAAMLARQKGIRIAEAKVRLGKQKGLADKAERIEKSLGSRTGGSFIDDDGNLVVTTLDTAASETVTSKGARAKRVDDSAARLNSIMTQLDRKSAKDGAGAVQGWFVDVKANTVAVRVTEGAADPKTNAMKKLAAGFGASVRIEQVPAEGAPQPAEWMVGGYEFLPPNSGECSVGFNTLDAWNRHVVLTAGHCVKSVGMNTRNGYWIGNTNTADFPGDDFGTFWNSYPGYWQPTPHVYKYDGTFARIVGRWDYPPVGTWICKSGRTTSYTCGQITATNRTVNYKGQMVYGLVQHSACVEGGDSGGANISTGGYAVGVTSGASMTYGFCQDKFGRANESYYQPVGEALSRNGLRLLL